VNSQIESSLLGVVLLSVVIQVLLLEYRYCTHCVSLANHLLCTKSIEEIPVNSSYMSLLTVYCEYWHET